MITVKKYVRAESLEEAYQLNQSKRNAIVGGMLWLKMGSKAVDTAIDLCGLGLDTIEEDEVQFSIGAMVSLRQLEQHEGLNACADQLFRKAVRDIVGVQFRNMATVGGSIWGRFGFSDVLTAFLAMDTYVELYHAGLIPLEQFAKMPPDRDVLVRILVKKKPGHFTYQTMRNQRTDFPVLTCAAAQADDGVRVVIGARPGRAVVLRDEDGLLSAGITEEAAAAFADKAAKEITVGSNHRGSAAYRSRLVQVLTQRCLLELGGMA